MSMLNSLKSREVPVDALENIKRSSVEVKNWPEWKLKNTLLAFSEYQRKKSIYNARQKESSRISEDIKLNSN